MDTRGKEMCHILRTSGYDLVPTHDMTGTVAPTTRGRVGDSRTTVDYMWAAILEEGQEYDEVLEGSGAPPGDCTVHSDSPGDSDHAVLEATFCYRERKPPSSGH